MELTKSQFQRIADCLPRQRGNVKNDQFAISQRIAVCGRAWLQEEQILAIHIEHVCLDSTTIKVHPDGTGALKKTAPRPSVVPWWMHHQNSSGCRECSVCIDAETVTGAGGGRTAWAGIAGSRRPGTTRLPAAYGQRLRRG